MRVAPVAILVPLLARPHRVAPLCDSVRAATPAPHRIVALCSPGDVAVIAEAERHADTTIVVDWPPGDGDYAKKVNAGYSMSDEPLLFLGADDLAFHAGWLEAACARLDPGIGVVGTNDLGNRRVMRGEHATHSLVTADYAALGTIDEPGRILHEGYVHEYVDDELVQTARHRGAWAFAADSVVEHLHPLWGKAPSDALYDAQGDRMARSRRLYEKRSALWTSR